MQKASIQTIVQTLNDFQVRYLIVGGLAVVAHGYVRFTSDIDLMLAIEHQNLSNAVDALTSLDYRPRAPVQFEEFINPASRAMWAKEKNMTVFSLFSPAHLATEIDLFLDPPIDFAHAYSNAAEIEIAPGIIATFCSLDDLIAIKLKAARLIDIEDVKHLRNLKPEPT